MKVKQSVWDKAKRITMGFEGSGYGNMAGNFDGQYLSLGFLQWNFGQGTLQPLFKRLFDEFPHVAENVLIEGGKWLKAAIEEGWEKDWAMQIQVNGRIVDPWLTALKNLCDTPEFQQIQDDAASWYKEAAEKMCKAFDLITDRAFCLFFDIAVQNGGISPYEMAETEYLDRLKSVAEVTALRANPQWQDDVRRRKMCIVDGTGEVHGGYFMFEYDDDNAFEDD